MNTHGLLLPARRNISTLTLEASTRAVEAHFWGEKGVQARLAWADIARRFFADELPWTLIIWGITAHSKCLGQTWCQGNEPPIITMHPSILGGTETVTPWGIPAKWLGWRYAYDVLLHECMHVAVHHLRGGQGGGDSSHNCPAWIAEVNRIAPLLGFPDVHAERKKPTRVKQSDGTSRIQRVEAGNIPFSAVTGFPYGLRHHYKQGTYYEDRRLPWEERAPADCNVQLEVTHEGATNGTNPTAA